MRIGGKRGGQLYSVMGSWILRDSWSNWIGRKGNCVDNVGNVGGVWFGG